MWRIYHNVNKRIENIILTTNYTSIYIISSWGWMKRMTEKHQKLAKHRCEGLINNNIMRNISVRKHCQKYRLMKNILEVYKYTVKQNIDALLANWSHTVWNTIWVPWVQTWTNWPSRTSAKNCPLMYIIWLITNKIAKQMLFGVKNPPWSPSTGLFIDNQNTVNHHERTTLGLTSSLWNGSPHSDKKHQ